MSFTGAFKGRDVFEAAVTASKSAAFVRHWISPAQIEVVGRVVKLTPHIPAGYSFLRQDVPTLLRAAEKAWPSLSEFLIIQPRAGKG